MAQEPKFKSGDVVKLKSGGPDMTVYATDRGTTNCVWWEPVSATYKTRDFFDDTLVLVTT